MTNAEVRNPVLIDQESISIEWNIFFIKKKWDNFTFFFILLLVLLLISLVESKCKSISIYQALGFVYPLKTVSVGEKLGFTPNISGGGGR